MMTSNPLHYQVNEQLRTRLDDFYCCAEDVLSRLYTQEGYTEMCAALCNEIDELTTTLTQLDEQYQEELPLESEEPRDVIWLTETERMRVYAEKLQSHPSGKDSESPQALYNRMVDACELMEAIDQKLFPEDDPDIYASYSKRELFEYNKFKWNKARRNLRPSIVSATFVHQNESLQNQLSECRYQLHAKSAYILSEDNTVIYHEGIGRHVWQMRHSGCTSEDVDELLCLIKSIEYFSGKLDAKLTFLERETSPNEEEDESVRLENLKQETLQNQHEKISYRLSRCEQYLTKSFSVQWIREMLTNLINSEHSAEVCDKMKNRKLVKFIHQVVGVLKEQGVFEDCTNGDLVGSIGYGKPAKASRIDYLRKGIDDVPEIQEWLISYIANYREQLRRQAQ